MPRPSLSAQSKLIIAFMLVAIGAALAVTAVTIKTGREALRDAATKQLTSIRAGRQQELEDRINVFSRQIANFAEGRMFIDGMRDFRAAYRKLDRPVPPEFVKAVERFYREEYAPRLAKVVEGGEPAIEPLLPVTRPAMYLQYRYIAANPKPFGEKAAFDNAGDGSEWSAVHERLHPLFRRVAEVFGYEDLLFVDAETSAIVYSVHKRPDFGTSLALGPYRETHLATLIRLLHSNPDRGTLLMEDFSRYRPALRQPVAFLGTPVFDGRTLLGYLVAGFPVSVVNDILTSRGEWEKQGLGKTGETYLVGPDRLLRSRSRFMMEDPKGFPDKLLTAGVSKSIVEQIRKFDNVILLLPTKTEAVPKALAGEVGVIETRDYRNVPTLTAYGPIEGAGNRWALLAEMDHSEAFAALAEFERRIVIVASALLLAVITLATWLARRFMRPVNEIADAAARVAAGAAHAEVPVRSDDEFGALAKAFNALSGQTTSLRSELDAARRGQQDLLNAFVPSGAIESAGTLARGATHRYPAVTVVAARIHGLDQAHAGGDGLAVLGELFEAFDDAARAQGLDPVAASSDWYVAAAGLGQGRLDRTVRAAELALEMLRVAQRVGAAHGSGVRVGIGIDAGPAAGGLLGGGRQRYLLFGAPVDGARTAGEAAAPGAVLVTAVVRDALGSAFAVAPAAGPADLSLLSG